MYLFYRFGCLYSQVRKVLLPKPAVIIHCRARLMLLFIDKIMRILADKPKSFLPHLPIHYADAREHGHTGSASAVDIGTPFECGLEWRRPVGEVLFAT